LSKFGCVYILDSVHIQPNFNKSKTTFVKWREYYIVEIKYSTRELAEGVVL
jgi:hypothetical protein